MLRIHMLYSSKYQKQYCSKEQCLFYFLKSDINPPSTCEMFKWCIQNDPGSNCYLLLSMHYQAI